MTQFSESRLAAGESIAEGVGRLSIFWRFISLQRVPPEQKAEHRDDMESVLASVVASNNKVCLSPFPLDAIW